MGKLKVFLVCAGILLASGATQAATIKIGALFAVSGPAAFLGGRRKMKKEMLVKEINAQGGIKGSLIEVVIYDTTGDATKAVQLANRLIKDDKVVAIVGPSTTGETMAVKPVTEKEKIPLISCAAGIKITDPVNPWTFKTPANDQIAGEKILNYAGKLGQKKLALLTVSDSFGSSGREQLKILAAKKGFTIVADETYGPKDTDMTAQLTKIRGVGADAIICWGTNPGPAVVTRNVKQLGITIPLYMSHGVASKKYIELSGAEAAEGVILPAGKLAVFDKLKATDPQVKLLANYDGAYRQAYGVESSTFGGYAYDGLLLIVEAIKKSGASSVEIRNGVEQSRNLVGVSGVFTMSASDHNGLDLSAFEMVKIVKGDWTIAQ